MNRDDEAAGEERGMTRSVGEYTAEIAIVDGRIAAHERRAHEWRRYACELERRRDIALDALRDDHESMADGAMLQAVWA